VLNGARPAELPVQQPTKFELMMINLKTAKSIGLTVSDKLLALAFDVAQYPATIVGVLHWIAYSMTIEISENGLDWYFEPGLWRKQILLKDIARVQRIWIPWWYGIGIKYTPQAWVYLVRPGDGVEIQTSDGRAPWYRRRGWTCGRTQ
jgi:hypothetical protein